MSMRTTYLPIVAMFALSFHPATASESRPDVDFDREVRPILQKCVGCHGPDRPKADLCLTSPESARQLGVIVPGDVDRSTLIERIASTDPDVRMPPDQGLSDGEVETLRNWIAAGARWPIHWAYRRLLPPTLPEVDPEVAAWCHNAIDRFVAAKLRLVGLGPSPVTDRRSLIRRVYFDLIGLPPSAESIVEFEHDARPNAYELLVDSLLASPHYGERWARHWMDVVHFAETHGHDQDRPREHAWPYRDFLIRRLNQDISYAQFAREQIAGDVWAAEDPWSLVGTGMLAAGPWDESSLRDIQENSIDREIGRYLDRDDIVTTVMSTFASTTVHCARCHHHKFDPISQDHYFGLQAVFAGIDKANREYDPDATVAVTRARLVAERNQVDAWESEVSPRLLDPELQTAVAAWESAQQPSGWEPVELIEFSSLAGATLVPQDDGSIYVEGVRPDKDTYVVLAKTTIPEVRAIRLTVLEDDRLPMQGPGRQENGNFHLSEIRIDAIDSHDRTLQQHVAITSASADFDQSDWGIGQAIDGNPNTAWGIHPQEGRSHHAVLEVDPATSSKITPGLWRFELQQFHGTGHVIGRFEISVSGTTGPWPWDDSQPRAISAILRVAPDERSATQRVVLSAYVQRARIDGELSQLPARERVYCGTNQFAADGSFRPTDEPRPIHVLERGEIDKPLRLALPSPLDCIEGLDSDTESFRCSSESARREALANWLSDARNGLFWRSIVNRLWHYHFGQPLVQTPNDFGNAGSPPSHQELLDWLAITLQSNDGSWKALHKLIVTSATYQQTSDYRESASAIDSGNRLLWRMNRKRLDAESFRDALLLASASLDDRMGGPSDRQFNQSKGVHVTPVVDYEGFDVDDRSNFRRSIYRFVFRTIPDPFMEALDCPDASQLSPQRGESLTAVQTLATMNDKFVVRQCELIANRIITIGGSLEDQIETAFRIIHGRHPKPLELPAFRDFVQHYGLTNACRLLVNTNEFMFID